MPDFAKPPQKVTQVSPGQNTSFQNSKPDKGNWLLPEGDDLLSEVESAENLQEEENEKIGWKWDDEGTEAKKAKEILGNRKEFKDIPRRKGERFAIDAAIFFLMTVMLVFILLFLNYFLRG